jgi:hypothetical protein
VKRSPPGPGDLRDVERDPILDETEIESVIARMGLPDPCTLVDLRQRIEQLFERPIKVEPYPPGFLAEFDRRGRHLPSGMVIDTEACWHVLYRSDTSATHQHSIIAHEFGHIVLGHGIANASPLMRATSLVDHESLENAAKRTVYGNPTERAAERFSRILVDHGILRVDRHGRPERTDWYRSILEG